MKNKLKDSNAPPRVRGTPVQCVNAGMRAPIAIGGVNEGMVVISMKSLSRFIGKKSETTTFRSNRFLSTSDCYRDEMTTPSWTATARGKPVVAKKQPVARVPVIPTARHVMELERSCSKEQISIPQQTEGSDSAFRPTGRDGPPGSFETISGVPAWPINHPDSYREKIGILECQNGLARGHPVQCVNAYPDSTKLIGTDRPQVRAYRMHEYMNGSIVQPVTSNQQQAVRGKPPAVRGKPPDARDRGHPPEAKYDAFHRVKLPVMGMVCTGSRDIEQMIR